MNLQCFMCIACICSLLIVIPAQVVGEEFHILVFGGWRDSEGARLYHGLHDEIGDDLPALEERASRKPYGGIMDGSVTVCSGTADYCYSLSQNSPYQHWINTFIVCVTFESSLVTTYDNSIWTFFGGFAGYEDKLHVWEEGMDDFEVSEVDTELDRVCSVRKNQTHVIVSEGPGRVYWYQENNKVFQDFDEGEGHFHQTGCGLLYYQEEGYKFIIVGGEDRYKSERAETDIYDFTLNQWTKGSALMQPTSRAASLQYQNTFVLFGGTDGINYFDTVVMYDLEEGFVTVPLKLSTPNRSMGVMHVPAPYLENITTQA